MIERDLHRLDLLRKCRSADALPLEELAARADGAAMAGETFVFDYAQLPEMVPWRADRSDPQLDIAIRLFLTAIAAAADRSFAAAELNNLRSTLVQISERLSGPDPTRPDPARPGPRPLHS